MVRWRFMPILLAIQPRSPSGKPEGVLLYLEIKLLSLRFYLINRRADYNRIAAYYVSFIKESPCPMFSLFRSK